MRVSVLAAGILLAGCAAPDADTVTRPSAGAAAGRGAPAQPEPEPADSTSPLPRRQLPARMPASATGPEALLPDPDSTDGEVARVGDLVVHERHVYEHLLETEPAAARRIVEMIVLDARVARLAAAHGIRVDPEVVEAEVKAREDRLVEVVRRELGGRLDYADYLQRRWGTTPAEHREWLRDNVVRNLYREYVLRYLALREDRVEVRYIAHSDPEVLEDVAARVAEGADFATLAIRHSEDANRMEGGLLPPFSRGFDHPVAEKAFTLEPGEVSDVFLSETDGSTRHYLVFCVREIPGREVSFEAAREEIEREMRDSPLTAAQFESAASLLLEASRELPPP